MKLIQTALSIFLILSITGCNLLTKQNEKNISKWMIPTNLAIGYFGAVGFHEVGHALTAEAIGAEGTRISVLPSKDDNGNRRFGSTKTQLDNPTDLESTLFNVAGPTAMFIGHMGTRVLLRSGYVPRLMQPIMAWFGLFNQLGYYGQTIYGLARVKHADLGKEKTWISAVMLLGGLTIDLIDFFNDEPDKYFGVLFGGSFYEKEKETDLELGLMMVPQKGGGFLGLRATW